MLNWGDGVIKELLTLWSKEEISWYLTSAYSISRDPNYFHVYFIPCYVCVCKNICLQDFFLPCLGQYVTTIEVKLEARCYLNVTECLVSIQRSFQLRQCCSSLFPSFFFLSYPLAASSSFSFWWFAKVVHNFRVSGNGLLQSWWIVLDLLL